MHLYGMLLPSMRMPLCRAVGKSKFRSKVICMPCCYTGCSESDDNIFRCNQNKFVILAWQRPAKIKSIELPSIRTV